MRVAHFDEWRGPAVHFQQLLPLHRLRRVEFRLVVALPLLLLVLPLLLLVSEVYGLFGILRCCRLAPRMSVFGRRRPL